MKRSHLLIFCIAFLTIIYTVPIVQTAYEYSTNASHRVQMLDIVEDIFVTPAKKSAADAAIIDSLGRLVAAISAAAGSGDDSTQTPDWQQAIEQCEESLVKITLLKQSVVDFNRHLHGESNRYAAADTVLPYFIALQKTRSSIDSMLVLLRAQGAPQEIARHAELLKADFALVRHSAGEGGAAGSYARQTLTALRRILVGAEYLRPFEKELEKSSLFANAVRPWFSAGYFTAFGDLGSKGIEGKNGWLFYKPDLDYIVRPSVLDNRSKAVDANDVAVTEDIVGSIVAFKNDLEKRGIDLLFVIMPTKASIYPDLLNPRVSPESAGKIGPTPSTADVLRKAGIETVDLFSALAAERARDGVAGDSIYLRTDTHFRNRGVTATAAAIAGRVKQYSWYKAGETEYACDSIIVERKGDIAEMTDLPDAVLRRKPKVLQPEQVLCLQVKRVSRDATGAVTGRTPYKDDFSRSPILVLGDSFSRIFQTDQPKAAGWIAHLARELSQPVASIVNDGGASTLVRQVLARKSQVLKNKKLVIWEVVERDFRFGEQGWKRIELP